MFQIPPSCLPWDQWTYTFNGHRYTRLNIWYFPVFPFNTFTNVTAPQISKIFGQWIPTVSLFILGNLCWSHSVESSHWHDFLSIHNIGFHREIRKYSRHVPTYLEPCNEIYESHAILFLDYTRTKSWSPWWLQVSDSWWVISFHFPWQFLASIAFHSVSSLKTPWPLHLSIRLSIEVGWHSTHTSAPFSKTLAHGWVLQALLARVTL